MDELLERIKARDWRCECKHSNAAHKGRCECIHCGDYGSAHCPGKIAAFVREERRQVRIETLRGCKERYQRRKWISSNFDFDEWLDEEISRLEKEAEDANS
jgi:hypothetical protein